MANDHVRDIQGGRPNMNIAENVERAAKLFPDKPAVIFEGNHLTYKNLNARVNRLANTLCAQGIVKGDRVALYLPNIPAFVICYLATVRMGAIAVSVNAMLKAEELNLLSKKGDVLDSTGAELISDQLIQKITNHLAHHLRNSNVQIEDQLQLIQSVFQLNMNSND